MEKEIKDLAKFVGKNNRIEISDVCFKNNKAVATDSFRLVEVEIDAKIDSDNAKNYPNYKKIFPKRENTIRLNANYLWEIALYMKRHGNKYVDLQTGDEFDPVAIYSETKDGKQIRSLIMPVHK